MVMRNWMPVAFCFNNLHGLAMAVEVHAAGAAVTHSAPSCNIAADALVDCNVCVTGQRKIPLKTRLQASAEHPIATPRQHVPLQHLDERGTHTEGFNVALVLSLPQKCVLNSYFKKDQKCDGVSESPYL